VARRLSSLTRADGQGGPAALTISQLSKTFAGTPALRSVSLDVRAGEVHALVGENGSGKSTLIKVLSGYHVPDPGAGIRVGGTPLPPGSPAASHRAGCRFVHQDLGLVNSLSVADNLTLGVGYPVRLGTIRARAWHAEISRALELLELDARPGDLVGELSPAAKAGVALARALRDDAHGQAVLLVLDEPTAALPSPQVAQLHAMVRTVAARGIGVLYVSHHLQEIFDLGDRVTVLRDGVAVATRAPSGLSHHALAELIVGRQTTPPPPVPPGAPAGRPVLTVTGLSRGPLASLTLQARAGEIVGIAGITGSGRDSVLAAVFGATARDAGTVAVDGELLAGASPRRAMKLGVAYLPPDRKDKGGVMSLPARENLSLTRLREFWRFPVLRQGRERAATARWFARLDIRPPGGTERSLGTFSGGNQQKVLLAKWLCRAPKVLLLEEPTQGVDIAAKALLHHHVALAASEGACVVVSSADNEELAGLCDRVIVLARGRACAELSGAALTAAALTHAALTQAAPRRAAPGQTEVQRA
jgi:ribose transport system ATP-binding protein